MRARPGFLLALPAWLWLVVFFVVPVLQVVWFSFGRKPGIFGTHDNSVLTLDRYAEALDPTFGTVFLNTLWIGVAGTALCALIGIPTAYWMAVKAKPQWRGLLIALVMIPYWTNFLVRTIGWQVVLAPEGWLSTALGALGILDGPLEVLNTRGAVLFGVVYNYLPLMILPAFVAFDRVDPTLREASRDLGAGRWRTLFRVTLPLAAPGLFAAVILVFIPLMGDYITPSVLGGAAGSMVAQLVAVQFQAGQNWALGSAIAVILILAIVATAALGYALFRLVALPFAAARRVKLGAP
ncbi:MAG: ABC transporter permease [Actinomycetales bacterium]|nr:ABC transporter permease [Actinomycetales bacterium]